MAVAPRSCNTEQIGSLLVACGAQHGPHRAGQAAPCVGACTLAARTDNEATQSCIVTKQRFYVILRLLHLPDDIGESREKLDFEHKESVPAEAQDDLLVEVKLVQEQVEVVLREVNRDASAFPRSGRQTFVASLRRQALQRATTSELLPCTSSPASQRRRPAPRTPSAGPAG